VLLGRQAPVVAIGGMGIVYLGYDPELDRRVAIKVLDLDARLELLLAADRGLAAAHAANMIHGDFMPDNILVGAEGRPRVADFGLALPILEFDRASDSTGESLGEVHDATCGDHTGVTISGPDSQSVAAIEVARAECRLGLDEDPSALIPELESALETSSRGPRRTNEALARIER